MVNEKDVFFTQGFTQFRQVVFQAGLTVFWFFFPSHSKTVDDCCLDVQST